MKKLSLLICILISGITNSYSQGFVGYQYTAGLHAVTMEAEMFGSGEKSLSLLVAPARKNREIGLLSGLYFNMKDGFFRASAGPGLLINEHTYPIYHVTFRTGVHFQGVTLWVGGNFGNSHLNRGFVNLALPM
jgi:hypothetical protein